MSYTDEVLDEVRARVAPDDDTLKAARSRRDDALGVPRTSTASR